MAAAFLWGGIGVLILFILIGFLAGLIRGLKRSALHIIFFVVSFVIAFFITKPITSAILGISITVDGTPTTLSNIIFTFLNKQFDLSQFQAVGDFAKTLPLSVASPIMFIVVSLLTYLVFDIIYLIVARIAFGKKKKDFAAKKPLRWYGSAVGAVEGFLFMFLLFAPLTSLTQTYESLATYTSQQASQAALVLSQEDAQNSKLPLLPEVVKDYVPSAVDEAIREFNKSVVGKVSGAGGLNHALFDYLSSSKVNKEKIHLRKDLLALAGTYNEFAVAYNAFTDGDYANLDLSALKTNLEKFLDEGIFKGVLAPTVQEYVVNFNIENAPDIIKNNELLRNLLENEDFQKAFQVEDFVAKTYLKDDLLKLVDIADLITKDDLLDQVLDAKDKGTTEILAVLSNNNEKVSTIVNDLFGLNILNDGFGAIGDFASEKLGEFVGNSEVKLNLSSEDKGKLITDTLDALNGALDTIKDVDLSKILDGDILTELSKIENLEQKLVDIGKALDKIRELDILVFEEKVTEPEPGQAQGKNAEAPEDKQEDVKKTYVFDQILEGFHIQLLGDKVHVEGSEEPVEMKDYETFFTTIAKPAGIAQRLELLTLGQEGTDFNAILDKLLDEMHKPKESGSEVSSAAEVANDNHDLLSQILLPFYELENASFNTEDPNMTIRKMIFDSMIEELNKQEQLNFTTAKETNTYDNWKKELDQMGETLLVLDDREHKIGEDTYIQYILKNTDLKALLDNVVEDGTLKDILKSLLKSSVFDNIVDDIFTELDNTVKDLTGQQPQAMQDRKTLISEKEEEIAQTFEKLVKFANENTNLNEINLADIGELLDSLKDGGIFKGVFENLIWYLTGDTSINTEYYKEKTSTFDETTRERVKAFLKCDGAAAYYEVNYAEKFASLDDVKKFLEEIDKQGLRNFQFDTDPSQIQTKVDEFLQKFDSALNGLGDVNKKKEVLTNTKQIIDSVEGEGKLLDGLDGNVKPVLKQAIEKKYTEDGLAEAIENLLGLNDAAA